MQISDFAVMMKVNENSIKMLYIVYSKSKELSNMGAQQRHKNTKKQCTSM